jgi:Ca2+-binding EF-hand superfamily protein
MHEAFDRLDVDGTGVITRANLRTVLGTDYDPEEVERMIKDGDDDDDGEVTYDEFRILMKDSTKKQIDDERVEGLRSPRS